MSTYLSLWNTISQRVASARSIGNIENTPLGVRRSLTPEETQLMLRVLQIFILENILHKHRRKHGTLMEPLPGSKALDHKIFMKTNWTFNEIRSMSLEDKLLVLHDEIEVINLSVEAQRFIAEQSLPDISITFEDFRPEEWNHVENKIFLDLLQIDYSQ
ncbi:ECs1072 family phage-associated protein [Xenorhabdus entomophaga]|uniref:ECs1072 family phage-associated protein n=1 Tax=Xenorhabdus entomophaga TaxID=3136257 RepID=UPI003BF598B8